ncbi:MAG: imidazole glycerol phosphate synthase subunit HisH [Candidatus Dormibacteraeota bacterium]|nr:imidazole glycerol phosphate synthase subunit HisH [Candidatus Dormibacteraeota bacterium]
MSIGVCDYGVGNLRSVERALIAAGVDATISEDASVLASCDGLILPGVGAFAPAADRLRETGVAGVVTEHASSGKPVLGVCLGHQLLFDRSDEGGGGDGLGIVPGRVTRLTVAGLKVPHMGWNTLRLTRRSPLLDGLATGNYAYFVHSYGVTEVAEDDVVATTDYGPTLIAAVQHGSVFGTQFHPEKSGSAGLRVYANFARICSSRPAPLVAS